MHKKKCMDLRMKCLDTLSLHSSDKIVTIIVKYFMSNSCLHTYLIFLTGVITIIICTL